ncbi:MAG TPA: hypothetical protein VFW09_03110 [Solirubrobacteraceae bacterium]|nr:hypothetical protein [Solirubrobacteraceae bacterium]
MPSLRSEHLDLTTATRRLAELRDRTRAAAEWCVALLIGGGLLWLLHSRELAFAVAAGAVAAVVVGAFAVDARRLLLLGLVVQDDATSIPEVGALADRLAHDPAQRRRVAAALRTAARVARSGGHGPSPITPSRVGPYVPRLEALADAIADDRRDVAPAAVALCRRLLCDGAGSPLYNTNLPERELDRALAAAEAGIAEPTPSRLPPATRTPSAGRPSAADGVRRPTKPGVQLDRHGASRFP